MSEQRAVRLVGHSWMVALPRRARSHLKVRVPGSVYFHIAGPREVVITARAARVGGKPAGLDLAPQLDAALREIDRLRAKLTARPQRVVNVGVAQGWMQAQRLLGPLDVRLETLARKVDALIEQRHGAPGDARRFRRARVRGRRRPVESLTLPDEIPSPSASPSVEVSGGDAASGGEVPQAAHE